MKHFPRISTNPTVIGGKPCIERILELYPYLEAEDISEALRYAAWRAEEIELPLAVA